MAVQLSMATAQVGGDHQVSLDIELSDSGIAIAIASARASGLGLLYQCQGA